MENVFGNIFHNTPMTLDIAFFYNVKRTNCHVDSPGCKVKVRSS